MKGLSLVDATLACYPEWWRDIYGDEIRKVTEDLVAEGRSERRLAVNLVRGALAVRLRGTAMPMRRELWAARTRTSIAIATLPWLVVLPFVLAATGSRGRDLLLSAATIADPASRVSTYSYESLQIVLFVSFCVVVSGYGTLTGAVRRSSHPRRRRLLLLSYVPLVSFFIDLGLFIARQTQVPHAFSLHTGRAPIPLDGNPVTAQALLVALWVVFVLSAVTSIFSLEVVTKHLDLPMPSLTTGKRIAAFTAFSITLMAALAMTGAVASGYKGLEIPALGNALYRGHLSSGQYLVVAPEWWLAIVPLTIAAVVSLAGWRSARRAWRVTSSLTWSL